MTEQTDHHDGDWFVVGASAIGTSHIKSKTVCQDRAGWFQYPYDDPKFLVAIVSDGAGSAKFGHEGAQITCTALSRSVRQYLGSGGSLAEIDDRLVGSWIADVRERVKQKADKSEIKPRQYAATLAALILSKDDCLSILIGDSIIAIKPEEGEWTMPIQQMKGEYASSTYFITDDPEAKFSFKYINAAVEKSAVLTDGIERLVMSAAQGGVKSEFFDSLFSSIEDDACNGRCKAVSEDLRGWLNSENICELTDDDKTLLLIQSLSGPTELPEADAI